MSPPFGTKIFIVYSYESNEYNTLRICLVGARPVREGFGFWREVNNRERHRSTTGHDLCENLDLGVLQLIPLALHCIVRTLGKRAAVPLI
jgi:hypothetical protein